MSMGLVKTRILYTVDEYLRMERASNDAAIGVAADDDLRHPQHTHRIFDGGRNTANRIRIRWDNIADHAADEQLPRFGLS